MAVRAPFWAVSKVIAEISQRGSIHDPLEIGTNTREIITVALALLILACRKDEPVAPEQEASTEVSATAIVGAAGGLLYLDGFALRVPSGAFSSDETLHVWSLGASEEFGRDALTELYSLEGLPQEFALPLELDLRCLRNPDPGLFLMEGRDAGMPFGAPSERFYDAYPAAFSEGMLHATLAPRASFLRLGRLDRRQADGASGPAWVVGVDYSDTLMSEGQHFRGFFRKYMGGLGQSLLRYGERAYDSCLVAGFDQTGLFASFRWPMDVDIRNFPGGQQERLSAIRVKSLSSGATEIQGGFSFNECPVVSGAPYGLSPEVASCFLGTLAGATALKIESKFPGLTAEETDQYLWLLESILAWGQVLVLPEDFRPYVVPSNFPSNWGIPFGGLPLARGADRQAHAAGWTSLLEHLSERYGVTVLATAFTSLVTNPHGVEALLSSIPAPASVWLPEYFLRYINGELYGINADSLVQTIGPTRLFVVDGAEDSVARFQDDYGSLSAKLYRVNLRMQNLSESATITFTVGPNGRPPEEVRVIVYEYGEGQLTYKGMADQVTIADLPQLSDAGHDLIAAVVNSAGEPPYDGTLPLELRVTVSQGQ